MFLKALSFLGVKRIIPCKSVGKMWYSKTDLSTVLCHVKVTFLHGFLKILKNRGNEYGYGESVISEIKILKGCSTNNNSWKCIC